MAFKEIDLDDIMDGENVRDELIGAHITKEEQDMIKDFCYNSSRMERAEALAVLRTRIKSLKDDIDKAARRAHVCLHAAEGLDILLYRFKTSLAKMKVAQQTKPEQTRWLILNFRVIATIIENTLESGNACRDHAKAVS